ncbi:monocarboxylate transporter 5 isoform X2 [Prorops nasuta]|uniref:monocarboxylate transporter 5 isoform X2 n=1 Tax=Prorops nasuta TaxID=863751 RepID=UPI0034CD0261
MALPCTDGMTYSFGVFYLELLYYFEEGKGATAWIASILVGVTLCSGPISGSFVNKYGCRAVTIAGAILASGCLLISVWAQSIWALYFTIGIGTGLGFGLIYLPAIVSVTCYFEKYRSLATGIAVCGSGLGTLIFAPFIEYLIAIYGWRGAIMVCAGIVLNCIVFGALFRPLEPETLKKDLVKETSKTPALEHNTIFKKKTERPNSVKSLNHEYTTVVYCNDGSSGRMKMALSQPALITKMGNHHGDSNRAFGSGGVMSRQDVLYQGSLESIRNYSNSQILENHEDPEVRIRSSMRSLQNVHIHKKSESEQCVEEKSANVFKEMLDLSLMKDPVFLLFTLSNFCTSIGFNIPYVYLLAQAEERGIEKSVASYLLAVIGVANTVGRIALGYMSDKPWVNRLLVYNMCLTVCGISTAFSTLCGSFGTFAFYCTVYGFTAGAYVGLTSVILVDLLGLKRLTNAFGLLLLFQGFASLLGPPIAGWLYDALQSYDPGFYTAGLMIAISGLMLFFINPIQRRAKRKFEENEKKCMVNGSQSA